MAASFARSSLALPSFVSPDVEVLQPRRRRRIDFQSGVALEILGHAIEYLADEFVHDRASFSQNEPRLQAVQILMAANREVYFSCPEVSSLRERLCAFLRLKVN